MSTRPFDLRLVSRRVTDVAEEVIPVAGYRSPAWHAARLNSVGASEIAAILGLSPWTSLFDLWWAKRLGESGSEGSNATRRGSRLEPLILEDFAEAHPDLHLAHVGLVRNTSRVWQVCTPDAVAYDHPTPLVRDDTAWPVAVVEAKTSGTREGWGDEGTDEVPVYYRAQAIWQMDTLGVSVAYVPVWVGYDYREYVVEYDADDAEFMRDAAVAFLDSLEAGTQPPVDGHAATSTRLKRLHPSVEPGAVEVPAHIVRQHQAARRLRDAAESRMRLAENRLRALMGDLREARVDRRRVASRSVYDMAERVMPPCTVSRLNVTKREINV